MESLFLISQFLVLLGSGLNVVAAIKLGSRLRKLLTISDIFGDDDIEGIDKVIRDLAHLDNASQQFNKTIKENLLHVSTITSKYLNDIKDASKDTYDRTIKGFILLLIGVGCQSVGIFVQIFIHFQSK